MFSEKLHQLIHQTTNLRALEAAAREVVSALGWQPASIEVIGRIVQVLAEHMLRHARDGHFRMLLSGSALEVVTEDRGIGFFRLYSTARWAAGL